MRGEFSGRLAANALRWRVRCHKPGVFGLQFLKLLQELVDPLALELKIMLNDCPTLLVMNPRQIELLHKRDDAISLFGC